MFNKAIGSLRRDFKAGLLPSELAEGEIKFLEGLYGDKWYKEFGFSSLGGTVPKYTSPRLPTSVRPLVPKYTSPRLDRTVPTYTSPRLPTTVQKYTSPRLQTTVPKYTTDIIKSKYSNPDSESESESESGLESEYGGLLR